MAKKSFAIMLIWATLSTTTFASFPDVPQSHSNYDAINYVQSENIVSGYPDNTYGADLLINRAEFTKIIVGSQYDQSTIDNCQENSDYSDISIDTWYWPFVCLATLDNIVQGYPDGTFGPEKNINFAEAAKIIVNTFGYETSGEGDMWYESFVKLLSEKKAIPSSIWSVDQLITRGEMAEMIYRLKENITDKPSASFFAGSVAAEASTEENIRTAFETAHPEIDYSEYIITIDQSEEGFAIGAIGLIDGGGAHWYAAYIDNGWLITAEVQDTVSCDSVDPYGFPATLVPICYDYDTMVEMER